MNEPNFDENLRQLAEAASLHQAGRLDAAEEAYAALLKSTPDDPIALINGGLLALARDDLSSAIERLQRATGLVPTNPVALGALAKALCAADRASEARPLIERALRIQPRDRELIALRERLAQSRADPASKPRHDSGA